jgi:hypothetical protein
MCAVKKLIYNDQIVLQLHRSKQSSPGITQQSHTAVLMWPSYFIYQHKYQQTYQIMGCFDTGKLSDSGTEKRLRNGPFAENARWQCFARVLHALQSNAPDDLLGVACGVLKPSAEQQGVQEQHQDGVLGGPRCRKESRQPTHAAWSSASAVCIIH